MRLFLATALFVLLSTISRAFHLELPEAGVTLDLPNETWRQTATNVKSPAGLVRAAYSSKSGAVVSVTTSSAGTKLDFPAFAEGLRAEFSKPGAKLIKEEKTEFGGRDAIRFQGSVASKVGTVVLNIVTYMVGDTAWTITCSAPQQEAAALKEALAGIKEANRNRGA
jgi:hypothetical protein